MNGNQIRLMVMCVLATAVIAGVVTTIGLVVPGAAAKYGVDTTTMSSYFTWFTGGVFAGYIASFVLFDHVSIRTTLFVSYALTLVCFALMHFTGQLALLAALMLVSGFAISVAVCGSSTLITKLWDGRVRQTVIISQDAFFNGGGVLFAAVATWFAVRELPFTSTYLVIGAIIAGILLLGLLSDFDRDLLRDEAHQQEQATTWNAGFILMGISLALFMLAKITVFVWAPQYLVERFAVSGEVAGGFMGDIFTAAMIGSIIGTWLSTRISVKLLVYFFVVLSALGVWQLLAMQSVDNARWVAYLYGFSISSTFNAYVAFSLTMIGRPSHRNIAYMLVMSSFGSSLAPLVSSWIVQAAGDTTASLQFCVITLVIVIVSLVISELLGRRTARLAVQAQA